MEETSSSSTEEEEGSPSCHPTSPQQGSVNKLNKLPEMSGVGETSDMLSEVTLDNACKTLSDKCEANPDTRPRNIIVTIGATVPTGFEVHQLRSVDNLFVVVQEFKDYQFKETKGYIHWGDFVMLVYHIHAMLFLMIKTSICRNQHITITE
ncbi:hypothetical protein JD844_012945 [Phrynosoma platyrhinos]|uniref:Uncharacterized protein n=1 Tax=Phrynosoma platyrhinos TaxID=52577 RepID=A0ABQ7TL66_PHRPL|nr:hypothetical protein JD844_012945 [Phrynosoma platyrhinos]